MKLHLGCSDDLKPGWLNVDAYVPRGVALVPGVHLGLAAANGAAFQMTDLNQRWPWEDSSADVILAHEVFEHIHASRPGNLGKVHCMNEAWRVLKPGGTLDVTVPCVSLLDGNVNPGAFADPTHCTFWTWDDQFYFSEQFNHECVAGTYGGLPEAGERWRLGEGMGVVARFRYPPVRQRHDRTWEPAADYRGQLVWRVRGDAGGSRSKLLGILEACK